MPTFGAKSKKILALAHPDLQRIANSAIKEFDFSVICSVRSKADQERAYRTGKSRAKYGQSPHNYTPSLAIDIVPYPLDWGDLRAFEKMGEIFLKHARILKIDIVWGKYFSGLVDYPHFELRNWKAKL